MGCGFHYSCILFLIISLQTPLSFSINTQGQFFFVNPIFFLLFSRFVKGFDSNIFGENLGYALLKFRARVSDPHGTLANWNINSDLCSWSGVTCVDGNVQIL